MSQPRIIKVFIASPGDLTVERRAFKDVVDELNSGFGRGADVRFEPLGWEDALSVVVRRSQDLINRDIDLCDVFVFVMWRRWGQSAPDAAERGFGSYTEEEFHRALARFEKTKHPAIFVFFKHIDSGQMADPGEQLKKVLDFRRKLEESRRVLIRGFGDEEGFRKEIDRHLVAFSRGEVEPIADQPAGAILPDSAIAELEKMRAEVKAALERAERAEREAMDAKARGKATEATAEAREAERAVTLAEEAATAALEGRIEAARQYFARSLDGTVDLRVLSLGQEFFARLGELDEAERLLRRWLAISGPDMRSSDTAAAYGNLGNIQMTRGDLDAAESSHKKALAIEEELGAEIGIARECSNLGIIEQHRGNLPLAQQYHKRSLSIHERLGMLDRAAANYSNLAGIEQQRNNFTAAEEYLKRSLAIEQNLGLHEQIASTYGNLGVIAFCRRDLDSAEAHLKQALAIDERLGRKLGIAHAYVNLGHIEHTRGNIVEARRLWTNALDLCRTIGARRYEESARKLLDMLD